MEMSNIVANDGASTPVAHTFTPQDPQQSKTGFATWFERVAAKGAQFWPKLQLRAALATDSKTEHVAQLKIEIPVVEAVAGVDKVVGSRRYFVTAISPYAYNSEVDMDAEYDLLVNVLGNAQVKNLFVLTQPAS